MGFPNNFMFRSGGSGGGTGGSAGINYVPLIFAGDSLTGVNTYNDGASAVPVDGTGGVVTGLTTALNTTTPLVGSSSLRFSKDAANRQGEGWSYDFSVDRISYDQSQPLYIQFYYKTSVAFASSDIRLFVYDRDGATLLNVQDISNNSGNVLAAPNDNLFTGVFYTNSSNNDYRLIWHIASTNASAWDIDLDNISVSPQTVVPGFLPAKLFGKVTVSGSTDWSRNNAAFGSFTAATGGTYVATGNALAPSTQLPAIRFAGLPAGDYFVVARGSFLKTVTTTNSDVAFRFSDGTNTFGEQAMGGSSAGGNALGYNSINGSISYATSQGPLTIEIQARTSTTASATNASISDNAGAGGSSAINQLEIEVYYYPNSQAALSTTDTLFTSAVARLSGDPASATAGNPIIFPTRDFDNLSAYNTTTGLYTIPKSGYYRIHGFIASAATAGTTIQAYVNSNFSANLGACDSNGEVTYTGIVYANRSDTISVRPSATLDAGSASILNIEEIPNFQIFSVYGQTELLPATGFSSGGLVSYAITVDQWGDLDSEVITPGEWDVSITAVFASNGATTTGAINVGVSTTSGNSSTGLVTGENRVINTKSTASGSFETLSFEQKGIVVTSSTTYYFKAFAATSITNLQVGWSWRFRRIK